jgi:acyl-CoA synthetase (AMP-forming)/AMP-acid ligase II
MEWESAMSLEEIEARLTGPGGPFEIVEEEVLGVPTAVCKSRLPSLRALLAGSIARGDDEYIVYDERRITFAQHAKLVASVAKAFQDRYDIRRGDRVGILAANCPEWIISFWAAVSLGAIAVALNGWWKRDEILYGLEHSEPKLLIGDAKRLARIEGVDVGIPVVSIEGDFDALSKYDTGATLPTGPIEEDDPAVILYTSGTTGKPKGAVNTHRGILAFAQLLLFHGLRLIMLAAEKGQQPDPDAPPICNLYNTPLFHLSGLYTGAVSMLASGVKTVWMKGRFDAGEVMRVIERERVTVWSPLGNMGHRLVEHPDLGKYDLGSVRALGSGGAPVSRDIRQRLAEAFPNARGSFAVGYGLSESAGTASVIFGEYLAERPDSVGRPLPTVDIEIRDPDGRSLPEGEEGEIHIRGPVVMLEYWRNPEATAEAILPGRWLRTGDIGRVEDGYLYINSRARDMILRNAENIHPVEIEQCIEDHPSVSEAAVIGVPHPEWGQEVKATVVPAAGAPIDTGELAAHCADGLAHFKVPTLWEVREEPLPRNAAGKILKNVLSGEAENTFIEE